MGINLSEVFEKYANEYLLKLGEDEKYNDLAAFNLLSGLVPSSSDKISAAEHAEIWLSFNCSSLEAVATEEDILFLVRCGVMYDSEYDALYMYV